MTIADTIHVELNTHPAYLLLAAMYGVELWSSTWHCTCDVAETLCLATAVTSAVASAAASCCSVFGSGAMSAVVPAVAACTDCCMWLPSFAHHCVAPQWVPLLFV
jgi:hypothetical protein